MVGDYKLISDFIPSGGGVKTESQWIKIEGEVPAQQLIQPDKTFTKIIEGKEVSLSFNSSSWRRSYHDLDN